jgi:hypothetical protein
MSTFDRSDRFQQELPDILTAIAAPRMPDYVDDLLAQAAATRQRPRWTFPERWLPMGAIARQQPYVPSPAWRLFLVAALLLALAAAALLATAGSHHHVPPPFGPARNGALLFGNGDIYIRDSIDAEARLIIGGPTFDFAAGFTRDGTRVTFLRRVAGTEGSPDERLQAFIADTDGSNVAPLTAPLVAPDWFDFAPDNGSIVYIAGDPATRQSLFVVNVGQPGEPRQLPTGNPPMSVTFPNFLAPTGDEIVFRGRTGSGSTGRSGIFAIPPDGRAARPVTRTDGNPEDGYQFPQPSPDGRYLAYTWWDRVFNGLRINLLDLRTGKERILTDVGRSEGYATFSPDSKRIVFVNFLSDTYQVMVEPVDGSSPPLPMGPRYRQANNESLGGTFSPDGNWVVVGDTASGQTRLVNSTKGGNGTLLAWSSADLTGWQRLAP